jgi:hypothetical protein
MAARKPTRKPVKKPKKPYIPQSAEAKAARQAIIMADLMGIEGDRARLSELSQGAYMGAPRLRSSGSSIASRYRIGTPKADKGYGKPPPKPKKRRG